MGVDWLGKGRNKQEGVGEYRDTNEQGGGEGPKVELIGLGAEPTISVDLNTIC